MVGAIVDADVVTLKLEDHAADALRRLRHAGQRLGQTVAVLGEHRELAGIVDLGDLLVARDRHICQRFMRLAIHVLNGRTPIRSAIEHPGWSAYDSLPVINRNGVFQGMLWRSAVEGREHRSLVEGIVERGSGHRFQPDAFCASPVGGVDPQRGGIRLLWSQSSPTVE